MPGLSPEQRNAWETDGFFFLRAFTPVSTCEAMYERIVEMARAVDRGESIGDALLMREEANVDRAVHPSAVHPSAGHPSAGHPSAGHPSAGHPEDYLSKLFRVHRDEAIFRTYVEDSHLLALAQELLGEDIDCFLSQFIAKWPGALGQPWHQDAFYFPFDRGPQVGLWLAITEAHENNSPLWVLPGSHKEPVHAVVEDSRPHANYGYVEIVDHDMTGAIPVLMQPGDLLVFHSHLMHRSTDNDSDECRMAMVYHLADGNTIDHSLEKYGSASPVNDWLPVLRSGELVSQEDAS